MIAAGSYLISPDHIAYANLAQTWEVEIPQYEQVGAFCTRIGGYKATRTGIFIRFADGSSLTFDDRDAATADLRNALTGFASGAPEHEASALPGFSYNDMTIYQGLPAELQAAIRQGGK